MHELNLVLVTSTFDLASGALPVLARTSYLALALAHAPALALALTRTLLTDRNRLAW